MLHTSKLLNSEFRPLITAKYSLVPDNYPLNVLPKDYKVITVDCRELAPPEPMIKVLEALEGMKEKEAVLMLHRKRPAPLLSRLEEQGLGYSLKEMEDGGIELLIWRNP